MIDVPAPVRRPRRDLPPRLSLRRHRPLATTVLALLVAVPASAQQPWRLQEELRIGSVDGPNALSRVTGITTDPAGQRVYVTQAREPSIRVFDAGTGEVIGTIGRGGTGPGEFRRIGTMSWRGDTLYVHESFTQRISAFTSEGEHLETLQVLSTVLPDGRRIPLANQVTPDGTFWASTTISSTAIREGGETVDYPVVVLDREGNLVREVVSIPLEGVMTVAQGDGWAVSFLQPFSPWLKTFDMTADGASLAIAREPDAAGTFTVSRVSHRGDTLFHRRYTYPPRRVAPAHRDSLLDHFAATMFQRAGARARAEAEKHVSIPDHQPPVTGVLADRAGRTWLRREDLRSRQRWLILDARGEIEGLVEMDTRIELEFVSGDVVWGIVEDELEVPYIVRYRLTPYDRSSS